MGEKKIGRPTKHTKELANDICELISEGKSLRSVCRQDDMPVMSTIWRWIGENEDFQKQYAQATEERAEALAEDMLEIADDLKGDTARDKLRIDTRKWAASKMKPKKYGDKLDLTTKGESIAQVGGFNYVKPENSNSNNTTPAK